jgi:hypothetical protein
VAASADSLVLHLAEDGTVLHEVAGLSGPSAVSVDATDGSCWVADTYNERVVRLASDGTKIWSRQLGKPRSVSADSANGGCWAAAQSLVVRFFADDREPLSACGFAYPASVSANAADGTCWVADTDNDQIVHVAANGDVLWRGGGFLRPNCVSVNPNDGSCWVADTVHSQVVHLRADGAQLWRGGGFHFPRSVSVNPADGSCWVADTENEQVVHLVIWFDDVSPDFWSYAEVKTCFFAGIVAGYGDGLYHPELSVTRDQMAVYISRALAGGDEYVPEFTGTATFPDVGVEHWALDYVEYAAAQNVVAGYGDGNYRPADNVNRAQMAVYVARAMVAPEGDAGLDDYVPASPRNFLDVPEESWGYLHIEYCVENGVVQGYEGGYYHPETTVTRDQMAVYVARAFGLSMWHASEREDASHEGETPVVSGAVGPGRDGRLGL